MSQITRGATNPITIGPMWASVAHSRWSGRRSGFRSCHFTRSSEKGYLKGWPFWALWKPWIENTTTTTQIARLSRLASRYGRNATSRTVTATHAIVAVIMKFRALRASELTNGPRSLYTSQMIREGRNPMIPPRWAKLAKVRSWSGVSGAPAGADGGSDSDIYGLSNYGHLGRAARASAPPRRTSIGTVAEMRAPAQACDAQSPLAARGDPRTSRSRVTSRGDEVDELLDPPEQDRLEIAVVAHRAEDPPPALGHRRLTLGRPAELPQDPELPLGAPLDRRPSSQAESLGADGLPYVHIRVPEHAHVSTSG